MIALRPSRPLPEEPPLLRLLASKVHGAAGLVDHLLPPPRDEDLAPGARLARRQRLELHARLRAAEGAGVDLELLAGALVLARMEAIALVHPRTQQEAQDRARAESQARAALPRAVERLLTEISTVKSLLRDLGAGHLDNEVEIRRGLSRLEFYATTERTFETLRKAATPLRTGRPRTSLRDGAAGGAPLDVTLKQLGVSSREERRYFLGVVTNAVRAEP